MNTAELIGSVGVGLILLAFAVQQFGRWSATSRAYLWTNAIGAGLACLSSYLIGFMPFVILEGVWCAVSLYGLSRKPGGQA